MGDQTVINIEELRKNKTDSLPYHLWSIALDCKMKRDSYWRHHHELRQKSDIISIPLLIFSTATGFFSVSQLNNNNQTIGVILTVVSIISAIIAALQKFLRFSERSENAKDLAKNYARLGRKIENTMVLVESDAVKMPQDEFTKFINNVQNECDMLLQETNDVPDELISDKDEYRKQLANLNQIKMSMQQPSDDRTGRHQIISLTREMDDRGLTIDDTRNLNQMMSREVVNKPDIEMKKSNSSYVDELNCISRMICDLQENISNESDDRKADILKNRLELMQTIFTEKKTHLNEYGE